MLVVVVVVVVVEADQWLWWPIEDLGDAENSAPSNLFPYTQKKSNSLGGSANEPEYH